MATAESVKAKLQGLIDAANAATGNDDADLTAAVDSLIDGYGGGGGEAYLAMINGTDIPESGGTLAIPEGVTRIPAYLYNGAISGHNLVHHIVMPSGLKTIGESAFMMFGAYVGDKGSSVTLNDDLETLEKNAFSGGQYSKLINIPASLISIGAQALANNGKYIDGYAKDIDLPNIRTIDVYAFAGFNFIGKNVHIGPNITSIADSVFAFLNSPSFTLTIDRAEDAISGAPWGATNATIVWAGDA